ESASGVPMTARCSDDMEALSTGEEFPQDRGGPVGAEARPSALRRAKKRGPTGSMGHCTSCCFRPILAGSWGVDKCSVEVVARTRRSGYIAAAVPPVGWAFGV